MNCGHQPFFDAESFFQEHMHQRRQAIGRAGGVGNDMMPGRIVLVVVYPHHNRDVIPFGGRGNDDLFGPGNQMSFAFVGFGEQAGRFDDELYTKRLPWQIRGILRAHHEDIVAVHDQDIIFQLIRGRFLGGNLALEAALRGIVLQKVGQIIRRNDIADCDHLELFAKAPLLCDRAENQPADSAKSVNCNFHCHTFAILHQNSGRAC